MSGLPVAVGGAAPVAASMIDRLWSFACPYCYRENFPSRIAGPNRGRPVRGDVVLCRFCSAVCIVDADGLGVHGATLRELDHLPPGGMSVVVKAILSRAKP